MPDTDWTRPKPLVRPAAPSTPLTIFYGLQAETIAQVCAVSLTTARAYKAGKRKPSKQVVRLIQLHNARRILPDQWRGWSVEGDYIFTPGTRKGLSRYRIEAYTFLMGYLFDWIAQDESKRAEVQLYLDQLERLHG